MNQTVRHRADYEVKIKITLENNENFLFELVNENNGYYSGWFEYD